MTKYIKKEDLENMIKTSTESVGAGLINSTVYTWMIGVLFLIFFSICLICILTIGIVFIVVLCIVSIILSPIIALELYLKNKE